MSEVIKKQYLDLGGLSKYDALIKAFIATGNSELSAAISALNAKIGTLEVEGSDEKTLAEIIDGIYASIAEIVEKQGALDAKDVELEGKINDFVGDVDSLGDSVSLMSLVEVANKLKGIEGSVSKNAADIVSVTDRVTAVEETIKELGKIEGGESLGDIVNEVKGNSAAIATLNGEGEGSVKKTAKDAADTAEAAAKAYADSLASNYDAAGAAATALDDAKAYVDGKVDGKFDAAGAAADAEAAAKAYADGLASNYDAAGAAAAAETAAKAYADGLAGNYDAAGSAADAEAAAKAYADGLASNYDATGSAAAAEAAAKAYADGLAGNYDAAGSAAAAETAAKAYADGLASNYDATGTAAGLNAAMDTRMTAVEGDVAVLKAIDHDKLAADAAATAVAAIVAGAESDFDTLKDVADWIGSHKEGAAELQTTVSGHTDSINTINGELDALEAKVDVDINNLTTHMSEAATKIAEVDDRLEALEAVEAITEDDINGLFA